MLKILSNHILSVREKIELQLLYGVVMFILGVSLHHFFSPLLPDEAITILETTQSIEPEVLPEDTDTTLEELQEEPTGQQEYVQEFYVPKGDSFNNVLAKAGVDKMEAFLAGKALAEIFNIKNLQIGQKLSITFKEGDGDTPEFISLSIYDRERTFEVKKDAVGNFIAKEIPKNLHKQIAHAGGIITSSLDVLANSLNIPSNILAQAIASYSFDVDFQRDLQIGDHFEVLYEEFLDDSKERVREGDLIYARLTVEGKDLQLYRFTTANGESDYYTTEGRTMRRSLLKTPIDGAIISSPFGNRKHPISGYTRKHKGVDFAAPRGTPFYAAGDGKIVKIGRFGGYGNYIQIRHNSDYSTAYGHISRFAKGMRKNRRVKQGQVIAYVGSTGASTGPHLHYEILRNGKHINPMKVTTPPGNKLGGNDLKMFKKNKSEIDSLLGNIAAKTSVKDELLEPSDALPPTQDL